MIKLKLDFAGSNDNSKISKFTTYVHVTEEAWKELDNNQPIVDNFNLLLHKGHVSMNFVKWIELLDSMGTLYCCKYEEPVENFNDREEDIDNNHPRLWYKYYTLSLTLPNHLIESRHLHILGNSISKPLTTNHDVYAGILQLAENDFLSGVITGNESKFLVTKAIAEANRV